MLEKVWGNLKRDLKKELPPEQAAMLDEWKSSDIQTDKVFREMANHQLGPFLQSMGIQEDPYDFFLDLFRLSLVFQLGVAALVFYTVELGLGGNAGDALRAVGGLLLGYTLRLGIKVEQLAWPIYNGLVQFLISEGATYEIPPATPEEQRETLNKLGVTIAAAFLVPKFVFGWQNDECWQMVVPMVGGLLFFDVAYMFGLLIKLGVGGGGGGGGDGGSQD